MAQASVSNSSLFEQERSHLHFTHVEVKHKDSPLGIFFSPHIDLIQEELC